MSDIQSEFEARITKNVAQFFHHADGLGLDGRELDGAITLRIEDGALAGVEFHPSPSATVKPSKRGQKITVEDVADLPLLDDEAHLVEGTPDSE